MHCALQTSRCIPVKTLFIVKVNKVALILHPFPSYPLIHLWIATRKGTRHIQRGTSGFYSFIVHLLCLICAPSLRRSQSLPHPPFPLRMEEELALLNKVTSGFSSANSRHRATARKLLSKHVLAHGKKEKEREHRKALEEQEEGEEKDKGKDRPENSSSSSSGNSSGESEGREKKEKGKTGEGRGKGKGPEKKPTSKVDPPSEESGEESEEGSEGHAFKGRNKLTHLETNSEDLNIRTGGMSDSLGSPSQSFSTSGSFQEEEDSCQGGGKAAKGKDWEEESSRQQKERSEREKRGGERGGKGASASSSHKASVGDGAPNVTEKKGVASSVLEDTDSTKSKEEEEKQRNAEGGREKEQSKEKAAKIVGLPVGQDSGTNARGMEAAGGVTAVSDRGQKSEEERGQRQAASSPNDGPQALGYAGEEVREQWGAETARDAVREGSKKVRPEGMGHGSAVLEDMPPTGETVKGDHGRSDMGQRESRSEALLSSDARGRHPQVHSENGDGGGVSARGVAAYAEPEARAAAGGGRGTTRAMFARGGEGHSEDAQGQGEEEEEEEDMGPVEMASARMPDLKALRSEMLSEEMASAVDREGSEMPLAGAVAMGMMAGVQHVPAKEAHFQGRKTARALTFRGESEVGYEDENRMIPPRRPEAHLAGGAHERGGPAVMSKRAVDLLMDGNGEHDDEHSLLHDGELGARPVRGMQYVDRQAARSNASALSSFTEENRYANGSRSSWQHQPMDGEDSCQTTGVENDGVATATSTPRSPLSVTVNNTGGGGGGRPQQASPVRESWGFVQLSPVKTGRDREREREREREAMRDMDMHHAGRQASASAHRSHNLTSPLAQAYAAKLAAMSSASTNHPRAASFRNAPPHLVPPSSSLDDFRQNSFDSRRNSMATVQQYAQRAQMDRAPSRIPSPRPAMPRAREGGAALSGRVVMDSRQSQYGFSPGGKIPAQYSMPENARRASIAVSSAASMQGGPSGRLSMGGPGGSAQKPVMRGGRWR